MAVGLVYLAFPAAIMAAFAPRDAPATIVALGAPLLALSAAWQLFDAVSMVTGETLRSAGDTKWCMWARLGIAWLLFAPLSYTSVAWSGGDPLVAIWCIVLYIGLLAAALHWRFRGGKWREIELTEETLV